MPPNPITLRHWLAHTPDFPTIGARSAGSNVRIVPNRRLKKPVDVPSHKSFESLQQAHQIAAI